MGAVVRLHRAKQGNRFPLRFHGTKHQGRDHEGTQPRSLHNGSTFHRGAGKVAYFSKLSNAAWLNRKKGFGTCCAANDELTCCAAADHPASEINALHTRSLLSTYRLSTPQRSGRLDNHFASSKVRTPF